MQTLIFVLTLLFPGFTPATEAPFACEVTKDLSLYEREAFTKFNSRLSHLQNDFGRPDFDSKLQKLLETDWPKVKLGQVSPYFYERTQNLVDQARLRHIVAQTIGLSHPTWLKFDWLLRSIALHGQMGHNLLIPLESTGDALIQALSHHKQNSKNLSDQKLRIEAVLRATDMYIYLLRWRVIAGELIEERAAESARKAAIVSIGLAGGAVIVTTTVFAGPIVAGAGATTASLSANPVVASLLLKVGEAAGGAALGFVGAPAATIMDGSYKAYTNASKRSANEKTSFACELGVEVSKWKSAAKDDLLHSALYGAGLGAGGSVLTFHPFTAKFVLWSTGGGVLFAQSYAAYQAGDKFVRSASYYRLAQEAEELGNTALAKQYLIKARDLAQESGNQALQTILIGVLTREVGRNFKTALIEGESAIRTLWAASADTIPSAINSGIGILKPEEQK